MARGQKKEKKELTPEERLQNALVPKEEWPYELPEGWKWVTLDGVCDFERGIAFPASAKESNKREGNIACLRTANVQEEIDLSDLIYVDIAYVKDNKDKLVRKGDIIMSSANSRELVGKVSYIRSDIQEPMTFGGFVLAIRTFGALSSFVFYYLRMQFCLGRFRGESAQTTNIANISTKKLAKVKIALPPQNVQINIVSFLNQEFQRLDEAKDEIQAILDSSEERKQSILHKAFTGKLTARWRIENSALYQETSYFADVEKTVSGIKKKKTKKVFNPFEDQLKGMIPEEWHLKNLDSISRQITDGEHATPSRVDNYCGYYLLSARNVRDDYLQLNDVDYVDEDEYKRISSRCNPKRGDVLISCSGSVGRVCVINDDNQYCMVRSAAMVSTVQCNPRFVMYMLQSPEVQKEIKELSKQTAQANLFLGAIATLLIPFPVLEEQNEIVQILDSYSANDNEIFRITEQVNDQIEEEKQSLLSKAFRGELKI